MNKIFNKQARVNLEQLSDCPGGFSKHYCFQDKEGKVYVFGSLLNDAWEDIDSLLKMLEGSEASKAKVKAGMGKAILKNLFQISQPFTYQAHAWNEKPSEEACSASGMIFTNDSPICFISKEGKPVVPEIAWQEGFTICPEVKKKISGEWKKKSSPKAALSIEFKNR